MKVFFIAFLNFSRFNFFLQVFLSPVSIVYLVSSKAVSVVEVVAMRKEWCIMPPALGGILE